MGAETHAQVLSPGQTCWRIERAGRFRVIVDAANYFTALTSAVQQAQHCVLFIGWDFDTRINLLPDEDGKEHPGKLGDFLSWIVDRRPDLQVYLLKWGLGMLQTLGRGSTPIILLDWLTSRRIRLRLDTAHPSGACHHQKIVVIDDALAFCGGIDITAGRWDTRKHLGEDPRRVKPTTGVSYGPWHDVTTAVDGDAAKALGDLARDRWKWATGETLKAPPAGQSVWPDGFEPNIEDVDVAIARTLPELGDRPAAHEIEALYLAAIEATKRILYIESQYFASRRIAEAMAKRLRESNPPEIVIVNPETADGWLEEEVMGSVRAQLLRFVQKADHAGHFRLYTPVTEDGTPIYVHAKVLVMDDRLLRVGSSNLNNRSLGFDTECDLAIEADADDPEQEDRRDKIAGLRNDLLAEHLDVTIEAVEAALDESGGSLIAAIEALQSAGRSLVPFEAPELNTFEDEVLADDDCLNPERPSRQWRKYGFDDLLPWSSDSGSRRAG